MNVHVHGRYNVNSHLGDRWPFLHDKFTINM